MIKKIIIFLFIVNITVLSQQIEIFNNPAENINIPAVLTDLKGIPKTGSMGSIDSKWAQSLNPDAENLLNTYSQSSESGLKLIIKNVLLNANIPENKLNQLSIRFTSSGIEERSIDKDAVIFKDDFAVKYPEENLLLINKIYATKNAVIEITDAGSSEFDNDVKDAISGGFRIGNKTETILGNKMIIESPNLIFAYEYAALNIERIIDKSLTVPLYFTTPVGINSLTNLTVTEGTGEEILIGAGSDAFKQPVGFKLPNVNSSASFRIGNKEGYTLTYIEKSGNKVTFKLSGYKISFP